MQSLIHPKADLGLFLLRMTFLDSCSSHHQVCVVHGLQHKTAQGRHSGSEPLRLTVSLSSLQKSMGLARG